MSFMNCFFSLDATVKILYRSKLFWLNGCTMYALVRQVHIILLWYHCRIPNTNICVFHFLPFIANGKKWYPCLQFCYTTGRFKLGVVQSSYRWWLCLILPTTWILLILKRYLSKGSVYQWLWGYGFYSCLFLKLNFFFLWLLVPYHLLQFLSWHRQCCQQFWFLITTTYYH